VGCGGGEGVGPVCGVDKKKIKKVKVLMMMGKLAFERVVRAGAPCVSVPPAGPDLSDRRVEICHGWALGVAGLARRGADATPGAGGEKRHLKAWHPVDANVVGERASLFSASWRIDLRRLITH